MYRTDLLIASTFALCGFAAALVAGASAGNPSDRVIGAGLLAMLICYPVGLVGAKIALVAVHEHLAQYRAAHPAPGVMTAADVEREANAEREALAAARPESAPAPDQPVQPEQTDAATTRARQAA